jgi:hypothetical protein
MEMAPRRMYANEKVRANTGKTAVMRGPMVYCAESCDNGELRNLAIPRDAVLRENAPAEPWGFAPLYVKGARLTTGSGLYSDTPPRALETEIKLIPYFAWCNREPGAMRVWLTEI